MKTLSKILFSSCLLIFLSTTIFSQEVEIITSCGGRCTFEQLTADIDINVIEKNENILWIGTNGGLLRYDLTTDTYQKFTTNDGLRNNEVLHLAFDAQREVLWIMTQAGLCRLEDNCFSYEKRHSNDYPYREYFLMELDNKNRLWLGKSGWACRLMRYDEVNNELLVFEEFSCYNNPDAIEIVAFEAAENGDMWLLIDPPDDEQNTETEMHLLRYVDAQNTFETVIENIASAGYTFSNGHLKLDNNNNLWISNNALLHKYDIQNDQIEFYYCFPNIDLS